MAKTEREAVKMLGEAAPAFTLAFLRACPDCVKLLNPEGRVTFVNRIGRDELALGEAGRTTGREWWSLWPEAERPAIRRAFDRARAGELVRMPADFAAGAGEPRRWDVTVAPVVNAEGETETILVIMRPA